MRRAWLLLPFVVSAGPPAGADESARRGVAAARAGDLAAAELHFAAASQSTADPGLIAFDAACLTAARGDFRGAEVLYLQALSDAACPPPRRAAALYNRGTCVLKRASDAAALRVAVAAFEQCLDLSPTDADLAADARFNLELAKLLWAKAKAKQGLTQTPNEPTADDPPKSPPTATDPPEGQPGTGDGPPQPGATPTPAGAATGAANARPTPVPAPGGGTLPVLVDAAAPPPISPTDARAHLARAAVRLAKDRKSTARMLAGPERPHVRDW